MSALIQTTGDHDMVCLTVPSDKIGGDWTRVSKWDDDFVKLKRFSPNFEIRTLGVVSGDGIAAEDYIRRMPRFALNGDGINDNTWYAIAVTAEVLIHALSYWMGKNPSEKYEYFDYRRPLEEKAEYLDGGLFGMKIITDTTDWQLHLWMSVRVAK